MRGRCGAMLDAPGRVLVACSSFGSKEQTSSTDALGHGATRGQPQRSTAQRAVSILCPTVFNALRSLKLFHVAAQSRGTMSCYPSSGHLAAPPNSCSELPPMEGRKQHETPYYSATGYSGTGTGRNNPSAEGDANTGPIPLGPWGTSGDWYNKVPHPGRNVMNLYPLPGNDCLSTDRDCDSFRMHGNNAQNDASQGCIVLPPDRTLIPPGEVVYVIE